MYSQNPISKCGMLETKFRVVISGLNVVGACPLRYSTKKHKFELVWLSRQALLTILLSLWYISIWIVYVAGFLLITIEVVSGGSSWIKPFTSAVKEDANLSASAVNTVLIFVGIRVALLPLTHAYQMFSGWMKCHELARFINNWQIFQQILTQELPNKLKTTTFQADKLNAASTNPMGKWKNLLVKYNLSWPDIFLITYVSLPIIVGMLITVRFNVTAQSYADFVDVSSFIRINFFMGLIVAEGFEDAKNLLMFFTLADAFKMIRRGILLWIKRNENKIDGDRVHKWREIIIFVRGQCDLACKCQKPSQLFFLAQCILQLTICSYLVLAVSWQDPRTVRIVINWGSLSAFCFCRLCIQAYAAELPGAEEKKIADILNILKTDNEPGTLLQINLTHQLITNDPTKIAFGNYTVLNKRLLLAVANQVVTYLIVILQFTQK